MNLNYKTQLSDKWLKKFELEVINNLVFVYFDFV